MLVEYWKDNFGDLLVEGKYWAKNVQGKNFDKFYDYPLSWESISKFPKKIKTNIINGKFSAPKDLYNTSFAFAYL